MGEELERQRNREMNIGAPRDAYGFEIKREYRQLHERFSPLWKEEEAERCKLWSHFFADELKERSGLPQSNEAVVGLFLKQYDSKRASGDSVGTGASTAAMQQFHSLVQAGVPMAFRGKYWQLFLNTDSKRKPGLYSELVARALEQSPFATSASPASYADESGALQPDSKEPVHAGIVKQLSLEGVKSLEIPVVEIQADSRQSPRSAGAGLQHTTWKITAMEMKDQCSDAPPSAPVSLETALDSQATKTQSATVCNLDAAMMVEPRLFGKAEQGIDNILATPLCGLLASCSDSSDVDSGGSWKSKDWLGQIEKDLHRTFPGHPMMDSSGRSVLRRILAAYARYNPAVGYCQGMNFIAACFMLFMEEEEAFWCLAAVVEDLLPGYFDTRMVAPQVDQKVFTHLLQASFPTVMAHLEALEVDVSSVTMHWFLVMFVNSLPLETCLRVWDMLFFEGSPLLLFRVALSLMDIYHKALLECRECSDAYMLLQSMGPMSFDSSRLVDTACSGFGHIKDSALRVLRAKYRPVVLEQMRSSFVSDEEFREYAYYGAAAEPSQSRSQSFSHTSTGRDGAARRAALGAGLQAVAAGVDAGHLTSGTASPGDLDPEPSSSESTCTAAGEADQDRQTASEGSSGKGVAAAKRLLPAAKQAMSALTARLVPSSLPPLLPSGALGATGEELPSQQGALAAVAEKLSARRLRRGKLFGRDQQNGGPPLAPESSDTGREWEGCEEAASGRGTNDGREGGQCDALRVATQRASSDSSPLAAAGAGPGNGARPRPMITPFADPMTALQSVSEEGMLATSACEAAPSGSDCLQEGANCSGAPGGEGCAGQQRAQHLHSAAADLDALDFRSPMKPPPASSHLHGLGPHRRTQSEVPWRGAAAAMQTPGHRRRRRRSFLPDLHRLTGFVPDFRQPAVVAAYQIAANPSPRHLTHSSSKGEQAEEASLARPYSRTPLSSVLGVQGGECAQSNLQQGSGVAASGAPCLAGASACEVGVPDDPVRVLRFEADAEKLSGDGGATEAQAGAEPELPKTGAYWSMPLSCASAASSASALSSAVRDAWPVRRYTDGDAAIGESPPWEDGDLNAEASTRAPLVPTESKASYSGKGGAGAAAGGASMRGSKMGGGEHSAAAASHHVLGPVPATTTGHSSRSSSLSASPSPATCSQLLRVVARLQEEVATAESRRHAAEVTAQQAQETAEQLRRQLHKLQQDAASKAHVVGDLEGRIAVVSGQLGDGEGELCAGRMAGDALQQQVEQQQRELARKDDLIRLLMDRAW